jgi:hypothetical protein
MGWTRALARHCKSARDHAARRYAAGAISFSREMEGKVRLPSDSEDRDDDADEKKVTLQQFAREHHIPERYEIAAAGAESVAGKPARRITFKPRPNQPRKNTADRFLDTITGAAWISEARTSW